MKISVVLCSLCLLLFKTPWWQTSSESLIREDKFHLGEGGQPAAVACQVLTIQRRCLSANQKVREHRLAVLGGGIGPAKGQARTPGGLKIQLNLPKIQEIRFHCLPGPSARGQLGKGDRTHCQLVLPGPVLKRFGAGPMVCVGSVKPGDNDRGIHQNHGRVLRRSSLPEMLPSHEPARSRMRFCNSLRVPGFLRASIASPRSDHCSTVPGAMPSARRISLGMVVVPFSVTTVSVM